MTHCKYLQIPPQQIFHAVTMAILRVSFQHNNTPITNACDASFLCEAGTAHTTTKVSDAYSYRHLYPHRTC